MYDTYKDWTQKERNGFWTNTKTGESTIWHPAALEIAGPLYAKSYKWCSEAASARNKKMKEQRR